MSLILNRGTDRRGRSHGNRLWCHFNFCWFLRIAPLYHPFHSHYGRETLIEQHLIYIRWIYSLSDPLILLLIDTFNVSGTGKREQERRWQPPPFRFEAAAEVFFDYVSLMLFRCILLHWDVTQKFFVIAILWELADSSWPRAHGDEKDPDLRQKFFVFVCYKATPYNTRKTETKNQIFVSWNSCAVTKKSVLITWAETKTKIMFFVFVSEVDIHPSL